MPTTPSRSTPDSPPEQDADVSALTYEEARDELVAVVARLEAGGASLEESLRLWERGEALAARCQQWLDGARERLAAVRAADEPPAGSATDPTNEQEDDR
ncbi:exodeoxyribonuclease VII small subunit [Cellulomonas sp. H30R-01]|uniref:exodeoxyribonuclease VII small subunit n=1 Tax=Cellulomonas sp. H30R-01 TaxID=2704467 RepID=UPI00138C105D|nr:exodeoxyribonuclease VII small subunit [Cellulomonas sp. H30R-01]QHT54850.1 exodeoxyribonuclease VII small subunit [Cellulomonas sp. H30R-01]